jgi:hypothetical protein
VAQPGGLVARGEPASKRGEPAEERRDHPVAEGPVEVPAHPFGCGADRVDGSQGPGHVRPLATEDAGGCQREEHGDEDGDHAEHEEHGALHLRPPP